MQYWEAYVTRSIQALEAGALEDAEKWIRLALPQAEEEAPDELEGLINGPLSSLAAAHDEPARAAELYALGLSHLQRARIEPRASVQALFMRGRLLLRLDDRADGRRDLAQAIEIAERHPTDEGCREVLHLALNTLATSYRFTPDADAAEPLLRRAIQAAAAARGAESRAAGIITANLARLVWDRHDYAQAEPLFARAAQIVERADPPPRDRTLASILADWATALSEQGREPEAVAVRDRRR